MDYFCHPRWRWLLMPVIMPSILVLVPLTLLTFTLFNGVKLWGDMVDWATYNEGGL